MFGMFGEGSGFVAGVKTVRFRVQGSDPGCGPKESRNGLPGLLSSGFGDVGRIVFWGFLSSGSKLP